MGATPEMFQPLNAMSGGRLRCIPWPLYHGEKTFMAVARRVVEEHPIRDNDLVGGASLGGMVALEIARLVNVKAVVLLGSALYAREINPMLLALSPLAVAAPFTFLQRLAGRAAHSIAQMFATSEAGFMRAMCGYIRYWPGHRGPVSRVYRIHGRRDRIITCPDHGSEVVSSGGHLVALSHARCCARFIEHVLTDVGRNKTKEI